MIVINTEKRFVMSTIGSCLGSAGCCINQLIIGVRYCSYNSHGTYGIRKLLHSFYKLIHPDLTTDFPSEARALNEKSLAQLNAYVDVLEALIVNGCLTSEVSADRPSTLHRLMFFRPYESLRGVRISGRVVPLYVPLEPIPISAPSYHYEFLASKLIREVEKSMRSPSSEFAAPYEPSIIHSKCITRESMNELWQELTEEAMIKSALYQPPIKYQNQMIDIQRYYENVKLKLLLKARRTANKKTRKKRFNRIEQDAKKMVEERYGVDEKDESNIPSQLRILNWKIMVYEHGFHPELLFAHTSLSLKQKQEGLKNICGHNLKEPADLWLLENLWKKLREKPYRIPVVLHKQYSYDSVTGFVFIPYNFKVWDLADFLEANFDKIREAREMILRIVRSV